MWRTQAAFCDAGTQALHDAVDVLSDRRGAGWLAEDGPVHRDQRAHTRRAACAYAGISDDSLERWAKRSADFADALTRAEAESEVALVALVRQAAQTDWRAATHLLERRWPDSWGRREKIDIEVYARQRARELGA